MSIFIAALAVLCVAGISFRRREGFEDYMSPQKTGAIKGIFVVIVLYSHIRQYVSVPKTGMNELFFEAMTFFGQLMVVMFLFYSGYGIAVSVDKKEGYIKTLPKRRILKVWLDFAIAVVIFFFTALAVGRDYDVERLLWSLIGVETVGNSNWFIFVIVILYALTFIGFGITGGKKHLLAGIILTTVLCAGAMAGLYFWKQKEYWWYDTVLCYPLGMWYYLAKPYIDKHLLNNFNKWFACTAATGIVFLFVNELYVACGRIRGIFVPLSLVFAILIVLASMRISVNNAALRWLGSRVFGIYILQRLPMMVLSKFGLNSKPIIFTLVCFAITLVLAEIFERSTAKLDELLHITPKKIKK